MGTPFTSQDLLCTFLLSNYYSIQGLVLLTIEVLHGIKLWVCAQLTAHKSLRSVQGTITRPSPCYFTYHSQETC